MRLEDASVAFSYFPELTSEPVVAFLSRHEIEIPQWNKFRGSGCFPTRHLPPSHPKM